MSRSSYLLLKTGYALGMLVWAYGQFSHNPLESIAILGLLLVSFLVISTGIIGTTAARYRTWRRVRGYLRIKPLERYRGSAKGIFRRLNISREKGEEIAWDYVTWCSYPEFHRPHLRQFPGVELEYDDRKRLAQIFYGK